MEKCRIDNATADLLFDKLVTEFVKNEIKPIASQIDINGDFPHQNVQKMASLGLMGIIVPKQYQGTNLSYYHYINAVQKISYACASTGVILSAHTSLCVAPILEFGNEEQKQKYLPQLCNNTIGAFGLTEPNAGTDASAQQTTATKQGDNYILNGTKLFITNAGVAGIYIIFAMTDKTKGLKGISAFIVESNTPGFTVGKKEDKLGIRASSTCELVFDNCVIPAKNLLGNEGEGYKIAMKTLDGGRIGISAQALGIAQCALDETIKYVKERKQFNKPLSVNQNTRFVIAQLKTETECARHLLNSATQAKQQGLKDLPLKASMAKLKCAQVAVENSLQAIQQHGGYGYTKDYIVERLLRDAKITQIYEGTDEVQKMVISSAVIDKK